MKPATDRHWWGTYHLEEDRWAQWRIGSSVLWIQRRAVDWVVVQNHNRRTDPPVSPPQFEMLPTAETPFDPSTGNRYVAEQGEPDLTLKPALADRPVVSRPKQPLHINRRSRATIFASTPLWVQVTSGSATLLDASVDRPSDTWFGPPTESGELCYATRISCRLRLEDIQTPQYRAVTAVSVHNNTDDSLHLKYIKLPVPYLELYAASDGRIWTQDVTLTRNEKQNDFATVELVNTAPREAEDVEKVGPARKTGGGGMVVRAFVSLFS